MQNSETNYKIYLMFNAENNPKVLRFFFGFKIVARAEIREGIFKNLVQKPDNFTNFKLKKFGLLALYFFRFCAILAMAGNVFVFLRAATNTKFYNGNILKI
jgi:hypothetical protein